MQAAAAAAAAGLEAAEVQLWPHLACRVDSQGIELHGRGRRRRPELAVVHDVSGTHSAIRRSAHSKLHKPDLKQCEELAHQQRTSPAGSTASELNCTGVGEVIVLKLR